MAFHIRRPNLNDIPTRLLSRDIQKSVAYVPLELRKENQTGVVDLEVVSRKTVTEVMHVRGGE